MKFLKQNVLYIALVQAVAATLGSLYFSELQHLQPCVLCWYQRICMYSLVPILTVGILLGDKNLPKYVLPLSIIGWLIALYHNLLYYSVIPEVYSPCTIGVSCITRQIDWFGFVSIPLLSLAAFSLINLCMILSLKWNKR